MKQETLKLFQENYENKGLCKNLESFVKIINKKFRSGEEKAISYLPWAVVERIFRMQGGKIEVVDWKFGVPFDSQKWNAETGEIEQGTTDAMFIHLKGTWQGEELEEFYPIFDNQTSKVIRTPDANDLNASRQRGSVRLIARLSGIGLWIFEQQEGQDSDDQQENEIEETKTSEIKQEEVKTPVKKSTKAKQKAVVQNEMADMLGKNEEVSKDDEELLLKGGVPKVEVKKEVVPPKETPKQDGLFDFGGVVEKAPTQKAPEKDISESHSDLVIEVKRYVGTHRELIFDFIRNTKQKEILSELTESELKELLERLKAGA